MPTNYSDTTPAPPAGSAAVKFQKSGTDVSAHVEPFGGSSPGVVPASESGDQAKFLQGDGTWGEPSPTFPAQNANKFLAGPASGDDAAPTFRPLVAADLPTQPFIVGIIIAGKPAAGGTFPAFIPPLACAFPTDLTGTTVKLGANPADATKTFGLRKNGVEFATVAIATNGTITVTCASGPSFNGTTDYIDTTYPASQDSAMSDITIMLKGTR